MADGDVDARITTNDGKSCNSFDNVDDYVQIPHNAAQLGANLASGFTISAWINPRTLGEGSGGNRGRILDKSTGTAGNGGFKLSMATTNRLQFQLNAGAEPLSANNAVPFGVWTHVLATISSAQLVNYYVNGVLNGTANQDLVQTIATITTTRVLRIGNRSSGTDRTFDGGIKDVKMWNRVLSTAEITAEADGVQTNTLGLIHWIKLGGDYADYGIVGVTATNSGSIAKIIDGDIGTAVKAQRVITSAAGKFIMCRGAEGQAVTIGITES